MRDEHPEILAALQVTPTDALQRGMAAFSHRPHMHYGPADGEEAGCFVWEAFYRHQGVRWVPFSQGVAITPGYEHLPKLSLGYECYNEWFKGECLRELAERGTTPEPLVPAAREAVATC